MATPGRLWGAVVLCRREYSSRAARSEVLDDASVDEVLGAVDVVGRCHERDEPGDLFGGADAAGAGTQGVRHLLHEVLVGDAPFPRDPADETVRIGPDSGEDRAGRDGDGAYALVAELLGDLFGEGVQGGLGDVVVGGARGDHPGTGRGDVDDDAGAFDEARQGGAGHPEGAVEVQVEGLFPGVVRQVQQRVHGTFDKVDGVADAHVVDQHVDPAELDRCVVVVFGCFFGGGEVDGHVHRPGLLEFRRGTTRASDHTHPLAQEGAYDGEAGPLAASGDHSGLAGELQIHDFSL